ncbi:MAG TPA: MFS transporter [Caldilineaceae bacterium]|nr:MFS transporter [Caldilineaceae bacterium]
MENQRLATIQAEERPISFVRLISTGISVRLLVDTTVQMVNPFLPIFAAGLGVDVVTMGRLVSLRSAMGLVAPVYGALADRTGYRRVMRITLLAMAAGLLLMGASTHIALAALAMALMGLGMAGFVPTLIAYLSARLPYAERARGIGMLEYSWALTGIVGLSLMGQLIEATNWRVPLFLLAAGILVMVWLIGSLPGAHDGALPRAVTADQPAPTPRNRALSFFNLGSNAASTYALLLASGANYFAAMQLMIVYGAWLADQYRLSPRELGYVALLFGCFDLTASVSVSLFTDRFGKRRSVLLGTAGSLLGYLLLPWLNVGLLPAILGAALARGFFEFAIVSTIPLLSEQSPNQRGKVMSLSSALALSASTVAAFVSPGLYTAAGIGGVALLSGLFTAVALLLTLARVREAGEPEPIILEV